MAATEKIRVFLVDDVPELRLLVRLTLEEDPAIDVVGEASDGREGVLGVADTQPDVVLLDLSMPDMDGLEAIPLMRDAAPHARLVVLSGHEAGRVSLEALDQGASRYVNKASDLDTVREVVREVAQLEPPRLDERFGVVRGMWEDFLDGQIDRMLRHAREDATWRPYVAQGREFHSHAEIKAFIRDLLDGRLVDPRAYGVQPHGNGLVVQGTLEIRGLDGLAETEVFWAFCFNGGLVTLAAGYDRREQALDRLTADCTD
jgi:DNA-binding NarL/FixJ family response regulator